MISAVKAVNFATAAVSVLSLQTAMLTEFGGDYHFVKFMNSATGCIVCLLILGTAFYMIVNASRHLRMPDQKEEPMKKLEIWGLIFRGVRKEVRT